MENIKDDFARDEKTMQIDRRNILIAEKMRQFLSVKLHLNQEIIRRDESIEKITLSLFIDKLSKLIKELEKMETTDPKRTQLEEEYYGFMNKYANSVILNEYEIASLLNYVKQSIMRLGICENKKNYNSSEIVRLSLLSLADYYCDCFDKVDKELSEWVDIFCSSDNAGFYATNNELYTINGYGEEYFTIKDGGKKVFVISQDGNISVNEDAKNYLLVDDLFIGSINKGNKRILTILSKKEGYYYPVFFDENEMMDKYEMHNNTVNIISLKDVLKLTGKSHLIKALYDKKELEYIVSEIRENKGIILANCMNKDMSLLEEEEKEEIPACELLVGLKGRGNGEFIQLDYELLRDKLVTTQNKSLFISNKTLANNDYTYFIKLNDLLALITPCIYDGLMPCLVGKKLIEESYDYKKLEYIMEAIKGANIDISQIKIDDSLKKSNLVC